LRTFICFFIFIHISVIGFSQGSTSWFYLRAKDTLFSPEFKTENDQLLYIGNDLRLKQVLDNHKILTFKKTFKKARKENLKKTFFVISEDKTLLDDLLTEAEYLFDFGELISEEDKKIFEPNDYGLTSTIGENIGLQVNLDYLDFLGLPKAWYYTTGSRKTVIGISDGKIDTTDLDFKGKTKIIRKSNAANGHGTAVASLAVGQGNNSHGVPGVCYDCSIYATNYGDFKKFNQLLELSSAGVKVINCSWVSSSYYETAQAVIDEMFENGTIIVAAAGNKNWKEVNYGKNLFYPASYRHVISVSSVMYKYESAYDNIQLLNNMYYSDNVKHHLARTMGFKDNDTLKAYSIYPVSVASLNKEVDILAPSAGLIRYSSFTEDGSIEYIGVEATSPAAPLVSGTIGLMYSLYPCLDSKEVESILKITSVNIDYVEVNKPFAGNYGAGALNIGDTVKMVYQLYSENQTAFIENQDFSRWDFKLTSFARGVVVRNQKFTDDATLKLKAKNMIVLGENTVLKPNTNGSLSFKIDPSLQKECELQLRDPSIED